MGSEIRKHNNLKSGKMAAIFQKPFEIRTKRLDFEWSGFQMVGAIAIAIAKAQPFENWTI